MIKHSGFALLALLAATGAAAVPLPSQPAIPGPRNLTGVWKLDSGGKFGPQEKRGEVSYTRYPYTPAFQADYDKRIDSEVQGRPVQTAGANCLPSGLGRMMTGGGPPLEILQSAREVIVHKENGGLHRIHLDRGHLPADQIYPTFYGDAVGRWEGDTLVVDAIGLGAQPYLDGRAVYSDAAHIVERFKRVDAETLKVDVTITDQKAFTRPISATAILKLQPTYELQEYYCTNERHRQNGSGDQSVIFTPPAGQSSGGKQ